MSTCIQAANALLGEGPTWAIGEGVLYWVDIKRPAIFRFDPVRGQTGHWPMPRPVGCVAPTEVPGRIVFADSVGFGLLALSSGSITRIAAPDGKPSAHRFNDGKVDPHGRFWAGTVEEQCKQPTGSLYRLDPDASLHCMASGIICANGIGWSPDERTMYFTDSILRTIWAYEFEPTRGELGERRVFATIFERDGVPDGLTVDAQGFVWSAIWDGWRIIRFAPDGSIDREVRLPVQRPTSCTFGGCDLRTLYITSASLNLDSNALRGGPLAGGLFALECDVPGLPQLAFGTPNV